MWATPTWNKVTILRIRMEWNKAVIKPVIGLKVGGHVWRGLLSRSQRSGGQSDSVPVSGGTTRLAEPLFHSSASWGDCKLVSVALNVTWFTPWWPYYTPQTPNRDVGSQVLVLPEEIALGVIRQEHTSSLALLRAWHCQFGCLTSLVRVIAPHGCLFLQTLCVLIKMRAWHWAWRSDQGTSFLEGLAWVARWPPAFLYILKMKTKINNEPSFLHFIEILRIRFKADLFGTKFYFIIHSDRTLWLFG